MTMNVAAIGRLAVAVHDKAPPTDDEWAQWIEVCARVALRDDAVALAIANGGGGPNARQRGQLSERLKARPMKAAVMTNSSVERGIVTVLNWLGLKTRAFQLSQFEEAVGYLGLSDDESVALQKRLNDFGLHFLATPLAS